MKTCAVVFAVVLLGLFGLGIVITVGEAVAHSSAFQTSHKTPTAIAHVPVATVAHVTLSPTTSKPTMTADQQAYFGQVAEDVNQLQSTITQFGQLEQESVANPAMMRDANWKSQMALVLLSWQEMYNAAKDVTTAPSGLGVINGKWIETLGHMNLASDHYAHGFDNLDPTLINEGTSELAIANTDLQQLQQLTQDFADQYN